MPKEEKDDHVVAILKFGAIFIYLLIVGVIAFLSFYFLPIGYAIGMTIIAAAFIALWWFEI